MNYINSLQKSIEKHSNRNAFCINEIFYTYSDFANEINNIRFSISNSMDFSDRLVGLILNDDIKTYAAIVAFWFEGKAYVPINPEHPKDRNETILNATKTTHFFDSANKMKMEGFKQIVYLEKTKSEIDLHLKPVKKDFLAYILFTSGSTGVPKGVPITYNNLNKFINAINYEDEFKLINTDKCLQMFELTFDFSVVSYVFPLLAGACVYTVPRNSIKYFYIYKLIEKHQLTVLSLVPSIIHYLKPYFSEIKAPQVRYCSFGGGALYNDIIEEWYKCIPNSIIYNGYGPTENTIYSSYYKINKDCKQNCVHNGIISIGKPLHNVNYKIIDTQNNELPIGEIGELALSSGQLTPGYWNNNEKTNESFFFKKNKNKIERFYKTGDLCFKDASGNYMFLGRIDFQVKIRGFRIELYEVEFYAKAKCINNINLVAIDIFNNLGNAELALAIESEVFDTFEMLEYMRTKIPDYMIPTHILFMKEFPYNSNGKIDRTALRNYFSTKNNE